MDRDKCLPPSHPVLGNAGTELSMEKQSSLLSCQQLQVGQRRLVLKSVSFFNTEWDREASQRADLPEVPIKHPLSQGTSSAREVRP